MSKPTKNKELKEYFEKKFDEKSARANGTILGYATGYYVISGILRYFKFHPDKKAGPIKLKKLAKYAYLRPLIVRKSDGLRFYRMLEYAENSNLLTIKSRRQFWNGSLAVIIKLNPNAKLSDYEVQWPIPPKKELNFLENWYNTNKKKYNLNEEKFEPLSGNTENKNTFWNDGWTEYDAEFIYKGIYTILLKTAIYRNDKKMEKEVTANSDKLYPLLSMIEQECERLIHIVEKL